MLSCKCSITAQIPLDHESYRVDETHSYTANATIFYDCRYYASRKKFLFVASSGHFIRIINIFGVYFIKWNAANSAEILVYCKYDSQFVFQIRKSIRDFNISASAILCRMDYSRDYLRIELLYNAPNS